MHENIFSPAVSRLKNKHHKSKRERLSAYSTFVSTGSEMLFLDQTAQQRGLACPNLNPNPRIKCKFMRRFFLALSVIEAHH